MVGTEKARVQGPGLSSLSGGSPVEGIPERLAEAVKPVGLFRTEDHRYYWNGEGPLPSVTTVLKVLDKPALTNWVARETAKAAWRSREQEVPDNEADYVSFLLAQPKEITDVAAKLGTSVHLMADLAAREPAATVLPVPDEALPYLEAFRSFLGHLRGLQGQILSSEHAVFGQGYAGTYDLLLDYAGDLWLVDIKTSKGYYPEFALQLAAYGYAEWIGLEGDPTKYPMPVPQRYGVLHLRPDTYPDTGWRLVEYPVTDRDYVAFLAALDLYQWKQEGRFTKSILNKALIRGELETEIRTDPLTTET